MLKRLLLLLFWVYVLFGLVLIFLLAMESDNLSILALPFFWAFGWFFGFLIAYWLIGKSFFLEGDNFITISIVLLPMIVAPVFVLLRAWF